MSDATTPGAEEIDFTAILEARTQLRDAWRRAYYPRPGEDRIRAVTDLAEAERAAIRAVLAGAEQPPTAESPGPN